MSNLLTIDSVVLVTGVGPNGLGETLCLLLASEQPARLIISGRSLDKVGASAKVIKDAHPKLEVTPLKLDLASLESIRSAADEVNQYDGAIDILINNAGVMNIPERQLSKDGTFERIAVSYYGENNLASMAMSGIERRLTLPLHRDRNASCDEPPRPFRFHQLDSSQDSCFFQISSRCQRS